MSAGPLVLVVCTANRARSAMAERIIRSVCGERGPHVASAGTVVTSGAPMAAGAAQALAEIGVDYSGFGAQPLTERLVSSASLVLTATRAHRADVLAVRPAAVRRTFTLLEFARLVDADARSRTELSFGIDQYVARVAASRGVSTVPPEDDDIADPAGESLDVFRSCRDRIVGAVRVFAPLLVEHSTA